MKRVKRLILLFICLCLLSSCIGDAREIDHRSMIVGMGLDMAKNTEDKEMVTVTAQIPILLTGGGEGNASGSVKEFETFKATGETIVDAVAQIESMTPTVLFFGHLKVVAISESIARTGIEQVIDFFDRRAQVANQIYLLIIEDGKAEEFITQESPLVKLPALYLNRFFQADQKISRTTDVKLFEYRRDCNMVSQASTLPLAKIVDEKIVIEGMGVFQNHKLVEKLTTFEVGISEMLKLNNVEGIKYTSKINANNEDVIFSISRGELTSKVSFEKKNPLTINIAVEGKGEITEVSTTEVNITAELVKKIETKLEKEFEKLIKETTKKMQEKNVEPWLIGHRLWVKDPPFFEALNWHETGWKESNINVTIDFEVEHTGQKGQLGKRKVGK